MLESILFSDVEAAAQRINGYVSHTPIFTSSILNRWLGHEIFFKAECLQKVGAFKARGAMNFLLDYIERYGKPEHVIANSSGNHAQAVAWAAKTLGLSATIYMPKTVSPLKARATEGYGANIVLGEDRHWVDAEVKKQSQQPGVVWVPPYNHPSVIAGQGTACREALVELGEVDCVVTACGGGGLLSGSYISARAMCPQAKVIGVEPAAADDAIRSRQLGAIQSLIASPNTFADGAMTLSVGEHTFPYICAVDQLVAAQESDIQYWYQWLNHLLKLQIEPTSAMAMVGVLDHLRLATKPQKVLVVLSGGNVDPSLRKRLWDKDCLSSPPQLV